MLFRSQYFQRHAQEWLESVQVDKNARVRSRPGGQGVVLHGRGSDWLCGLIYIKTCIHKVYKTKISLRKPRREFARHLTA